MGPPIFSRAATTANPNSIVRYGRAFVMQSRISGTPSNSPPHSAGAAAQRRTASVDQALGGMAAEARFPHHDRRGEGHGWGRQYRWLRGCCRQEDIHAGCQRSINATRQTSRRSASNRVLCDQSASKSGDQLPDQFIRAAELDVEVDNQNAVSFRCRTPLYARADRRDDWDAGRTPKGRELGHRLRQMGR